MKTASRLDTLLMLVEHGGRSRMRPCSFFDLLGKSSRKPCVRIFSHRVLAASLCALLGLAAASLCTPEAAAQAKADLSVTMSFSPSAPRVGDIVLYTIKVTNNGPDDAHNFVLILVPGTTSGTIVSGCFIPNTGICTTGGSPLSPGSQYAATFLIQFIFAVSGTYTSAAIVTADEPDPNTANNSATTSVPVRPLTADLSVTMSVSPSAPKVGDIVLYTIKVTNHGPDDAHNFVLTLVPGTASGQIISGCFIPNTGICTTGGSPLSPGSQYAATFLIRFTFNVSGTFTSVATVTANEFDPNTANNSASASVTVPNPPPIARAGPDQKLGTLGAPVTFTLDGSASSDPDGNALTFKWFEFGGGGLGHVTLVGSTPVIQLTRGPGNYYFSLTVNDGVGGTGSDSVSIQVVSDTTAPLVAAPDITVSTSEPGGARGSASSLLHDHLAGLKTFAVDNFTSNPFFAGVLVNGVTADDNTFFPEGETPVTVLYRDQAGNTGLANAMVRVRDLKDGDLFVAANRCIGFNCFNSAQQIRGGSVSDFCITNDLAGNPHELVVDSDGRIVFQARVVFRPTPSTIDSGIGMYRCSAPNAPPEQFAFFREGSAVPPGWTEPFPGLQVFGQPFSQGTGGLHLARLREVVIDDNQNQGLPFMVNEDAYVFDLQLPNFGNKTVRYHVKQDFWEDGPDLGGSLVTGFPPAMHFHSGATYMTLGGTLRRVKVPIELHATGQLAGVGFDLRLQLFGSSGEISGWILNDETIQDVDVTPTCPGTAPIQSGGFISMSGFYGVVFDNNTGLGLTLISNSGASGIPVHTDFKELPFDDPGNKANFFFNPFIGCLSYNQVRYTPWPQVFNPQSGASTEITKVITTPSGLVASATLSGQVVQLSQGSPSLIASGLDHPNGIGGWPVTVSAGTAISVLIRIDSPVDVLVTDPNGKKLGMENGVPVNDLGNDGSDTGAGSHPRFYAINNPIPGDYRVDSVGTGIGPFTVHVYSVDTAKPFGKHIFSSGNAAPGALSSQNFTMVAGGGIAFTNHLPTANAGPDQTVNAAANGTATVNLDGSASNDPDGDSLTFTWAGPFGAVSGAQPQVVMPTGVNVLQLTVDDGKSGTASSNVTITVNAPADTTPPVVTPPASITIPATEAGGARGSASAALAAFLAAGSAIDAVDPSPMRLSTQVGGVDANNSSLFPLGTTVVTFRFQDASGNLGSATASVTVVLGTPRISAAVIGKGVDASGARYVDLQLTNTGTGNARNVKINQLPLRTLSGSGTVSYNTTLSPALPISIGSLDVGGPKTVRLFFNVPATVTRYSLTESGTLQDVAATNYSFSASQSVIP